METSDRTFAAFIFSFLALCFLGLLMVYSSSYIYAREYYQNPHYFFLKQCLFMGLGLVLGLCASKTKFSFWIKYSGFFYLITLFLLFLTLVPGISVDVKGASRWLHFSGFTLQIGEFAKIFLALFSIKYFEEFFSMTLKKRIISSALVFMTLLIFLLQPDYGSFLISLLIILFVGFLSHFPRKYFYMACFSSFLISLLFLILEPYRVKRLITFLDPWKDPQNTGFQIIQSFLAFANGSIWGKGIGNSYEKLFYLPEAHNDFIFSVIGEELGLLGVCLTVGLYLTFILAGFRLTLRGKHFSSFLFLGTAIFMIGVQAFFNMGVVLGLLPTKGLNLPFISYGGSSLIASTFLVGLFLSGLRYSTKNHEDGQSQFIRPSPLGANKLPL